MSNFSGYDDIEEDDDAAWSCASCPIRYLSALGIVVAMAILVTGLCGGISI